MTVEGHRTLTALQGLRGIAALLVVCDHAIFRIYGDAGANDALSIFARFLGTFGVQIFFVISGFVMVLSHGDDFGKDGAARWFMAKRLGRIVPLYWLTTLGFWARQSLHGGAAALGLVVLSLLFVPHQEPGQAFGRPVYELGWTLEYEMAFYLVFATALLLKPRPGYVLIFATFLILVALAKAGLLGIANIPAYLGKTIILYFLAGVAIGCAKRAVKLMWGFWTAALGALSLVALATVIGGMEGGSSPLSLVARSLASIATVAVCAFALDDARARFSRISSKLGDATYSIYLTHIFVLGPAAVIFRRLIGGPGWMFVLLMIPATATVGMIVYRFIERPLVRGIGDRIRPWRPAPAAI